MSSNQNGNRRVENLEQTNKEFRVLPRIFNNVSISLASIAFTFILLFAAYQGYEYFRGKALYVRLTEIIFLVVVASLVIVLLLLFVNVALLLLKSATHTGKFVSKDISEIRGNLNPGFQVRKRAASLLTSNQPQKELAPPKKVVDSSIENKRT